MNILQYLLEKYPDKIGIAGIYLIIKILLSILLKSIQINLGIGNMEISYNPNITMEIIEKYPR